MSVNLSPLGGVAAQFFNNDGVPLAGGLIYTYAAGTNTPSATYTTGAGTIAHSNPIVLDSAGRIPTGEIWLTDGVAYKFVIKDASLTLIGTYDNIVGINSNFVNYTASQEIQTATAGQTLFTLTTMQYQPGSNSLSVFVDGVNQYGPGAQYAFVETSSTSVTFASGLHVGASVKFTTAVINNIGGVDASQVTYEPPFANSVSTNVEIKLSQYVSVKDFGAVGNGVADDTNAIKTCFASVAAMTSTGATTNAVTIFFPKGTYLISDTIVPPRAVANEGFIRCTGDGYLGTTLRWSSANADRIFVNASNTPRLAFDNFILDVKSGAGKPAYGLAFWGAPGQHSSQQKVGNLLINGMKVGAAGEQGYSYINSSGVSVPAFTVVNGSQDSLYENIIVESCDYGFLCGHTDNQYTHLRLTNTTNNMEIYAASYGSFYNCYFGAGVNHVYMRDPGGAGATNLQNFNNCWFEGGGTGTYVFTMAGNGTTTYNTAINLANCVIADSQYFVNAGVKVSSTVNILGSVNWGAGGVSTTNAISADTNSTINTYNFTGGDFLFNFSGAGTLLQQGYPRQKPIQITVGNYDFVNDFQKIGASAYGGSTQGTRLGSWNSDGSFTSVFQIRSNGNIASLYSLSTYANNAAAISGGLVAGDLYKTSTGAVQVVY
jgi:hypothetical protein